MCDRLATLGADSGVFHDLPQLTYLNLSHNVIEHVSDRILSGPDPDSAALFRDLMVKLHNNQLQTFPARLHWPSGVARMCVSLVDNPLDMQVKKALLTVDEVDAIGRRAPLFLLTR